MGEIKATESWFARRVEEEAKKDIIPLSERLGNIVAFVAFLLFILYFVAHQMWSTGFFTSSFGSIEMFLFYASLLIGLVPVSVRILVGRKNLARLFDIFGYVLFIIAVVWLYVVFPFDFTHVADVLPTFIRFLLQWVSNDIARGFMVIVMIIVPIVAVYNAVLYMFVRKELSKLKVSL